MLRKWQYSVADHRTFSVRLCTFYEDTLQNPFVGEAVVIGARGELLAKDLYEHRFFVSEALRTQYGVELGHTVFVRAVPNPDSGVYEVTDLELLNEDRIHYKRNEDFSVVKVIFPCDFYSFLGNWRIVSLNKVCGFSSRCKLACSLSMCSSFGRTSSDLSSRPTGRFLALHVFAIANRRSSWSTSTTKEALTDAALLSTRRMLSLSEPRSVAPVPFVAAIARHCIPVAPLLICLFAE